MRIIYCFRKNNKTIVDHSLANNFFLEFKGFSTKGKNLQFILFSCLRPIIYDRQFMDAVKVTYHFYSEIKQFIFISCNQLACKYHSAITSTEFRLFFLFDISINRYIQTFVTDISKRFLSISFLRFYLSIVYSMHLLILKLYY